MASLRNGEFRNIADACAVMYSKYYLIYVIYSCYVRHVVMNTILLFSAPHYAGAISSIIIIIASVPITFKNSRNNNLA